MLKFLVNATLSGALMHRDEFRLETARRYESANAAELSTFQAVSFRSTSASIPPSTCEMTNRWRWLCLCRTHCRQYQ